MAEEVVDCTFYPEGKKPKSSPDEHDGTFRMPPEKKAEGQLEDKEPAKKK